jgi:hypothetical protein
MFSFLETVRLQGGDVIAQLCELLSLAGRSPPWESRLLKLQWTFELSGSQQALVFAVSSYSLYFPLLN